MNPRTPPSPPIPDRPEPGQPGASAGPGESCVVLAQVRAPHGVRGWLRLALHTRHLAALRSRQKQNLRVSRTRENWTPMELEGFRPLTPGKGLAKFSSVNDRDAAAKLRGFHIAVPRADLPEAAADEFYWHDLVGMEVVGRNGDSLGKVAGLIRTGAHDILRVSRISPAKNGGGENEKEGKGEKGGGGGESEILIPFVSEFAPEVDLAARVIRAEWEADW